MRIAVLYDGAGLARLGLEQAGHECLGVELNEVAHHLSKQLGSGNCIHEDARNVNLSGFDAVWASPPCQKRSLARAGMEQNISIYKEDHLDWCLERLKDFKVKWIENVRTNDPEQDSWGCLWNANQFLEKPIQNRMRIVGGTYPVPKIYRSFNYGIDGICPAVLASEYKQGPKSKRNASRFYGRRLTLEEVCYHQGLEYPKSWQWPMPGFSFVDWDKEVYMAVGNGVPVYMARAFGEAAARINLSTWIPI